MPDFDPLTDPYNVLLRQVALARTEGEREAARRAVELWEKRNPLVRALYKPHAKPRPDE
jgi:hypothetical protein